jgi:glycosyltransferase involved in cell wall biosynthesis
VAGPHAAVTQLDAVPIRVLALSPIPIEGAGCRFRIAQYVPYLRDAGFEVTIKSFYTRDYFDLVYQPGHGLRKAASFVGLALRTLNEALNARRYDLVFLYREAIPLGPPVTERLIARQGVPIVYDFDDAIFLPAVSEANRSISFLKDPGRVARIIKMSNEVVVGNEFLASFARQYHDRVAVIPTAVDTDRFVPGPPRTGEGRDLTVGWIGSPTTFPYLQSLAPQLQQVAARRPFVLKVSGAGKPVRFPGVRVEEVPWSLAQEVTLFNSCDVGVYPLTDDEWAQGKCGFKAIQFMSCGVPVVAAAVGVNNDIVRDGENGLLAATPAEWVEKLDRLLTDAALRARLAAAGRATIEQGYSLRVTAPRLADIMRRAVRAGGSASPEGRS